MKISLHERALEYVSKSLGIEVNHGKTDAIKISTPEGGVIPDLIDKDKIIEVEICRAKNRYYFLNNGNRKKVLIIVTPSIEFFEEVYIMNIERNKPPYNSNHRVDRDECVYLHRIKGKNEIRELLKG